MVLIALLAGCGGKKDEEPAATGPAKPPAAPVEEMAHVLPTKALHAVTGRAGTVDFTIDVPDEAAPPRAATNSVTFDFKDSALQLGITAVGSPIGADELAKKRALSDPAAEQLVRADEVSGGGYVVTKARKDKTWFLFEHCRNIPSGNVCCAATMRSTKPYPHTDAVIAWVTDVCQHMTVGGEPHATPVAVDPTSAKRR
jgi:hypothetical protein